MKKTISILLIISTLTLSLVSCIKTDETKIKNETKIENETKITEEFIISELTDSVGELEGTLTITSGTSENVLAFNYIVTINNAETLMNENFKEKAHQSLLSNHPENLTHGQLQAVVATMGVVNIFWEEENSDINDYIDGILSIIYDGSERTYGNWTISASVDQASDILTIKAIHN